jgi:hypothetical protein
MEANDGNGMVAHLSLVCILHCSFISHHTF